VTTKFKNTEKPRILVVDENAKILTSVQETAEFDQFRIATAASVAEALHLINAEPFDVLLSDWRMTEFGAGFAVVSAMHKTNSNALTLAYTGYVELKQALDTILLQSYELRVNPTPTPISPKLMDGGGKHGDTRPPAYMERVADILENEVFEILMDWLGRVEHDDELTHVPLNTEERIGQYPRLIWELALRLHVPRDQDTQRTEAAIEQGRRRQSQGYSMGMITEEFRLLKLSIFEALYTGMSAGDFRIVLSNAETITDECDCQLRQILAGFTRQTVSIAA
jgi:CheY-like chemotaxis protein